LEPALARWLLPPSQGAHMIKLIIHEVTDCRECPFFREEIDIIDKWVCTHPSGKKLIKSILIKSIREHSDAHKFVWPKWCPLPNVKADPRR